MTRKPRIAISLLVICVLILGISGIHRLIEPAATLRVDPQGPVIAESTPAANSAKGGWYRIPLPEHMAASSDYALFVPFPMADLQVRLNGRALSPIIQPGAANNPSQYVPKYFQLPAEQLRTGDKELMLWIYKNRPHLALPSVYLGEAPALQVVFKQHEWLKIRLMNAIIVAMLVIAAIMATVWAYRRHETFYGWLALSLVLGGLRISYFTIETIPVPLRLWDWFGAVALGSWTIAMVTFMHRLLGEIHPRLEKTMIAGIALIAILLLIVGPGLYYSLGIGIFYSLLFIFWAFSIGRLVTAALRGGEEANVMLASGVMLIVVSGRDLLLVLGLWPKEYGVYIPYGVGMALAAFTWLLLKRYFSALNEAEQWSKNLERRVEEKHAELQQNYARISQLEAQRVLTIERERIMRDMHDGVGGQLLHLISSVEMQNLDKPAVVAALSETLDDLQTLILSLDPTDPDLGTALANMRPRLQRATQSYGVTLNWALDALAEFPALGPERTLHAVRIVQEAVNNALKHAKPHTLTVSAGLMDDGSAAAYLAVSDDGSGMQAALCQTRGSGAGLKNMARRAELMGARLMIESSDAGTTVRLVIPPDWFKPGNTTDLPQDDSDRAKPVDTLS